jgi:hypothetical protein
MEEVSEMPKTMKLLNVCLEYSRLRQCYTEVEDQAIIGGIMAKYTEGRV